MILPIETDDALDALRKAREAIGVALDELHHQGAPTRLVAAFTAAHDACAWCVEHVDTAMTAVAVDHLDRVDERHVSAQVFPHMDDL